MAARGARALNAMAGPGRFVLFGHPVSHSWSPFIHGTFARQFDHVVDYKVQDEKGGLGASNKFGYDLKKNVKV